MKMIISAQCYHCRTLLKAKVIDQAKKLRKTTFLDYLIQSAEDNPDEDDGVSGK